MEGGVQVVVCRATPERGPATGGHDLEEGDAWTTTTDMKKWVQETTCREREAARSEGIREGDNSQEEATA